MQVGAVLFYGNNFSFPLLEIIVDYAVGNLGAGGEKNGKKKNYLLYILFFFF